ncbi:hypothetical protein [Cellulosimicrobium sp. TH-20]|uniref:hypothetical protein n=1 Tax=Cellulosimicrobium sp. TH-20 TaxID=1980001 RepID=UPI001583E3ED
MEAALLQEYAPRDPLAEYLDGRITLRKLRVMIEHLPPGSALHRALYGPWGDTERLLHAIANHGGALLTLTNNIQAAKAKQEQQQFVPIPGLDLTEYQREQQEQELDDAEERVDLLAVLTRAQVEDDDGATTT